MIDTEIIPIPTPIEPFVMECQNCGESVRPVNFGVQHRGFMVCDICYDSFKPLMPEIGIGWSHTDLVDSGWAKCHSDCPGCFKPHSHGYVKGTNFVVAVCETDLQTEYLVVVNPELIN